MGFSDTCAYQWSVRTLPGPLGVLVLWYGPYLPSVIATCSPSILKVEQLIVGVSLHFVWRAYRRSVMCEVAFYFFGAACAHTCLALAVLTGPALPYAGLI